MARRDPMALLEMAGANDFGEVGYDPAAVGYDPASVGEDDDDDDLGADIGAVARHFRLPPAALKGALAKMAQQRTAATRQKIQGLTAVGHVPAGTVAGSVAVGIGATAILNLTSFIPLRIYRVDMSAAVTATGADASGSVVINSFQFANRGLFDGTGTPAMSGFRPDANGRPPIRNIVVYPNTPIALSLTNNNAAAVTATTTLYGSTAS